MKRLFLFNLGFFLYCGLLCAQTSLIASLKHGDEISVYYGEKALQMAHDAAVDGDVITLSSGTFSAVYFNKGVTIRGAGMEANPEKGTEATIVRTTYGLPQIGSEIDKASHKLTFEGVFFPQRLQIGDCSNLDIIKCRFPGLDQRYGVVHRIGLIGCKITDDFVCTANSNITCVNCIIRNPSCQNNTAKMQFLNSMVWFNGARYGVHSSNYSYATPGNHLYSTFENCIIYSTTSAFSNTANVKGCLSNLSYIFDNIEDSTNHVVSDLAELFITFRGDWSNTETFELTDSAKARYFGNDSTEVGIYGGLAPYDPTPTNPQITKCNVASKATVDGKLSVDIEVVGLKEE